MNENFKTINYKGTEVTVSKYGEVYWDGKKRNWYYNTDGYAVVSIKIKPLKENDKGWRSVGVHVLVALAFVPNPYNLSEVNHKDYNRKNPYFENLEWISHADNVRYSVCNKPDLTGRNNPNYGNKKLSERYKRDKQLSIEKQSRKGLQNGRCTPISLYCDDEFVETFSYIVPCCQYLIGMGVANSTNIESVRGRINGCIRKGIKYKKYYSFIKG